MSRSRCPDAGRLQALLQGHLSHQDQASVCAHLEGCAACQNRLEALVASGPFWSQAARHLARGPAGSETALGRLLSRLAAAAPATRLAPTEPPAADRTVAGVTAGVPARLGPYEVLNVLGQGGM